jgi:hypothetical protein
VIDGVRSFQRAYERDVAAAYGTGTPGAPATSNRRID